MTEALTVKTGVTYTVTDLALGATRHESFSVSGASAHGRVYSHHSLSISDISFRTPVSDIRVGMCGAMTRGDEVWRVRVTEVKPVTGALEVRGLALTSDRTEWLDSSPLLEPPQVMPNIWTQFYDL